MSNQVLIIGLNESDTKDFPEITSENSLFRDGLCIVQPRTNQQANILLKRLRSQSSIKAYPLDEFYQLIDTEDREYDPLHRFTPEELIDFQSSGNEQFMILNSDNFSVFESKIKEFNEISTFQMSDKCVVSSDGVFLCFYMGNRIEIRAGKESKKFNEIVLDSPVVNVSFSPDTRLLVIFMSNGMEIWDIFMNERLMSHSGTGIKVIFDNDIIYLPRINRMYSISSRNEMKPDEKYSMIKEMIHHGNQTVTFSEDRTQRIHYRTDEYTISKTHANIDDITFYFSSTRCFALIVKTIQKVKTYFLESYGTDGITLTQLVGDIERIEVSDRFFVTVDSDKTISFYNRDRFGFNRMKEIRKEDDVLIGLHDTMCCAYDSDTGNIEFYDNGELRSVYSHQSCTDIKWSHSGLYVASISIIDGSGGLVQMFNSNGKLLWKKVFNRLNSFMWRPFMLISDEEKISALEGYDEFALDISDDENAIDTTELLSKWKSYLLSRKQRILMLR